MATRPIYNVPYGSANPATGVSVNGTLTLMQVVAPSTRQVSILEWSLSGKSVTATDVPVTVYLCRQTTAGTSSATITPAPVIAGAPAALSSVATTFSAEPTESDIIAGPWYVTPVGGNYTYTWSLGDEPNIAASGRVGFKVVTAQATTLIGYLRIAE